MERKNERKRSLFTTKISVDADFIPPPSPGEYSLRKSRTFSEIEDVLAKKEPKAPPSKVRKQLEARNEELHFPCSNTEVDEEKRREKNEMTMMSLIDCEDDDNNDNEEYQLRKANTTH